MRLTIVIPALNEEQAIASIIERTLAAREHIVSHSPVTGVDVVVVSDGSTDGTVDIARSYEDINLIVFEKNQGYGAAIKRGFSVNESELVGFLDADGTCDPRFFAELCSDLCNQNAAIALGSRLGPNSEMPPIRRLGNRIYATILSVLTNRLVHDTASGMRVIRREALDELYPLPDGLNFTPAMSARALLDERLPIVERPMSYKERVGESKLSVVRDGVRFLQTIIDMTLFVKPARVFLSIAIVCGLITVFFAAHPIEMWLTQRRLEESMIYRLLFCSFLGSLGVLSLSALIIAQTLRSLERNRPDDDSLVARGLRGLFSKTALTAICAIITPMILWLVGPGIVSWVGERQVYIHWSRVVLAGLLTFTLCQLITTKIVVGLVRIHIARLRFVTRQSRVEQQTRARRPLPIPKKPLPDLSRDVVLT
ncbi:MAG: glycosyltransferase family 2 protein [Phycisphaerales bacterium]|nr:glycosyltransferase family 2 protein [Phycisphaerales bacterium]